MYTKTFLTLAVAVIGFAASTASMAFPRIGESPDERPDISASFMSTQSRMQVRDATVLAYRNGLQRVGENSYLPARATIQGATKTRAQVRAETKEAQALGLTTVGEYLPVASAAQLQRIEEAGRRVPGRGLGAE